MKKTIRKILPALLLSGSLLAFFPSCQPDFDISEKGENSFISARATQQYLRLSEIYNPDILKMVEEAANKNSGTNYRQTGSWEEQYDIYTENVLYTKTAGYETYTFSLIPKNPEEISLVNWVISTTGGGSYVSYLMKYNLNEKDWEDFYSQKRIDFSGKIQYRTAARSNGTEPRFGDIIQVDDKCFLYTLVRIQEYGLPGYGGVNNMVEVVPGWVQVPCRTIGSQEDPNTGGGTTTGTDPFYNQLIWLMFGGNYTDYHMGHLDGWYQLGGGASSFSGSGTIRDYVDTGNPVRLETGIPPAGTTGTATTLSLQANPLKILNALTERKEGNTNPIRRKIDEYVAALNTAQVEDGIEFRKGGNDYYPIAPLESGFDYIRFAPPAGNSAVYIHLHHSHTIPAPGGRQKALAPVPSTDDLFIFAKTYTDMGNTSIRNTMASIVVTRNGLYAIMVKNKDNLISFYNQLISSSIMRNGIENAFDEKVIKRANKDAASQCNSQPGGCTTAQLNQWTDQYMDEYFIEFMNKLNEELNGGIDVYKGTLNPAGQTYSWNKTTN